MLSFVTAQEASMEAFMSVSADSPYQSHLETYAASLLKQGYSRSEWCLLALDGQAAPVARAALWAPPGAPAPTDVVLIEADWTDDELANGRAVLTHAQALATELGASELGHSLDSPPTTPQYQDHDGARARLMSICGYELLRDGLRWRLTASTARESPADSTLEFRSLPDVGEGMFVEAIADTYRGTRDSWINRTIAEYGLLGAARADFAEYQAMEHQPDWWELAYSEDGPLAGVIMAARNPSVAVIGYVGVVPEQRGRGFARQLVARGTERLLNSGADEIRGDCDQDNIAMARAFERAGYEQFARRRSYSRALARAR